MNIKRFIELSTHIQIPRLHIEPKVIATFGTARLVRQSDGRHELHGGTPDDCQEAREWCSIFAPEVVFGRKPGRTAAARGGCAT